MATSNTVACEALYFSELLKPMETEAESIIEQIERYQLDVENILQKPELPNGCEIVSGDIQAE